MRIGILTQPLKLNYGGILQAYALQEILRRMGHDAETVHLMLYADDKITVRKVISYIKRNVQKYIFGKNISTSFVIGISKKEYNRRSVNIWPFVQKYIKLTDTIESISELGTLSSKKYDAIIVGSDQVWVPGNMPTFLLDFTEGWDIRRISYAASFGHSEWRMGNEKTLLCSKYAKLFDAISVREESGVELCKEHLGVEATHVLDPTLLLDSKDYLSIIKEENNIGKTVFSYILDSDEQKKKIVSFIADYLGAEVISTLNTNTGINDKKYIQPSIDKWISGIAMADFVITDSFHGTVFSIIFRKQFAVMGNPTRGLTRIYSLLSQFGLEERFISQDIQISNLLHNRINYEKVEPKLEEYRRKSIAFLKEALI